MNENNLLLTDNDIFLIDLITHKASIHEKDEYGRSFIFNKSAHKTGFLKTLIKFGLDINEEDVYGKTPLFYCDDINIFSEMLNYGADINHKDNGGKSVIFYYHDEQILNLILNHPSFDINAKDNIGNTILSSNIFSYHSEKIQQHMHKMKKEDVLITTISNNQSSLLRIILANGFSFKLAKKVILGYPPETNIKELKKVIDIFLMYEDVHFKKSIFYFDPYYGEPARLYTLNHLFHIAHKGI